jgi:hypothetical protein
MGSVLPSPMAWSGGGAAGPDRLPLPRSAFAVPELYSSDTSERRAGSRFPAGVRVLVEGVRSERSCLIRWPACLLSRGGTEYGQSGPLPDALAVLFRQGLHERVGVVAPRRKVPLPPPTAGSRERIVSRWATRVSHDAGCVRRPVAWKPVSPAGSPIEVLVPSLTGWPDTRGTPHCRSDTTAPPPSTHGHSTV